MPMGCSWDWSRDLRCCLQGNTGLVPARMHTLGTLAPRHNSFVSLSLISMISVQIYSTDEQTAFIFESPTLTVMFNLKRGLVVTKVSD